MNEEKEKKVQHFIIAMLTTLLVAVSSKLISLLLTSETVFQALEFLLSNISFLISAVLSALTGGYFGAKWTGKDDC